MHMLERVVANWLLIGDMSFCLFFDRKHFLLVWQKKKLQQSAPSAVLVCIMHYFTRSHTQTPCSKIWNLIQFFREINFTKFSWNWFQKILFQQKPTFFIALYLHFYCIVWSNDFFSQLYFFHRMIWWCLCIKTCKLSMWFFFSFAHFIYILKV